MMKVEIWSDYACPFCYIGKRRFEAALGQFAHKDNIQVEFKSFELDPSAKRDAEYDVHDMLAQKYGMSREQAIANNANLTEQAAQLGLAYDFDGMILTNTFDAHRLSHFSAAQGKAGEMTERLLSAYFTESKHIGDRETLADLAAEAGLDREEALNVLQNGEYAAEVRADEQEAGALGVRGVPFFVFDRKYAVSGAQPPEVFLQALTKAWQDSQPFTVVGGGDADVCGEDGCVIPGQGEQNG